VRHQNLKRENSFSVFWIIKCPLIYSFPCTLIKLYAFNSWGFSKIIRLGIRGYWDKLYMVSVYYGPFYHFIKTEVKFTVRYLQRKMYSWHNFVRKKNLKCIDVFPLWTCKSPKMNTSSYNIEKSLTHWHCMVISLDTWNFESIRIAGITNVSVVSEGIFCVITEDLLKHGSRENLNMNIGSGEC
jgi:hypothetical protein